jgi:hypothetical protein
MIAWQQACSTSIATVRSVNECVRPADAAPTAASGARCSARLHAARCTPASHENNSSNHVTYLWSCKRSRFCSKRSLQACRAFNNDYSIENIELVIGDCVALLLFCLYKQITAIALSPTFPGWLAPLAFNPIRFVEFSSFALTVIGTWAASAALVGGYRHDATAGIPITLARVSRIFLVSMPVAAAQLVLVAAVESDSLVGGEGFASKLPLAAAGPGEPFVTAAGGPRDILGGMGGILVPSLQLPDGPCLLLSQMHACRCTLCWRTE